MTHCALSCLPSKWSASRLGDIGAYLNCIKAPSLSLKMVVIATIKTPNGLVSSVNSVAMI